MPAVPPTRPDAVTPQIEFGAHRPTHLTQRPHSQTDLCVLERPSGPHERQDQQRRPSIGVEAAGAAQRLPCQGHNELKAAGSPRLPIGRQRVMCGRQRG